MKERSSKNEKRGRINIYSISPILSYFLTQETIRILPSHCAAVDYSQQLSSHDTHVEREIIDFMDAPLKLAEREEGGGHIIRT